MVGMTSAWQAYTGLRDWSSKRKSLSM